MFLITVTGDWDNSFIPVFEDDDVFDCKKATVVYTGVDFTATALVSNPNSQLTNSNGVAQGVQTADFEYSWTTGGWSLDGTGASTGVVEVRTYEIYCTTEHDGEYLYASGACGCEETFIDSNQPQLFYDPNSPYYNHGSIQDATIDGGTSPS